MDREKHLFFVEDNPSLTPEDIFDKHTSDVSMDGYELESIKVEEWHHGWLWWKRTDWVVTATFIPSSQLVYRMDHNMNVNREVRA